MAEFKLNTRRVRSLLTGLIALCSTVVLGNVAEICDTAGRCPARLAIIIALATVAVLIATGVFLCALLQKDMSVSVEIAAGILLLIIYSVIAGLISSVRTGLGNVISVSFTWISIVLSFVVAFLAVTAEGSPVLQLPLFADKKELQEQNPDERTGGVEEIEEPPEDDEDVENGESPEEAYMQGSGQENNSDPNDRNK